jgi:hypothetical protein
MELCEEIRAGFFVDMPREIMLLWVYIMYLACTVRSDL